MPRGPAIVVYVLAGVTCGVTSELDATAAIALALAVASGAVALASRAARSLLLAGGLVAAGAAHGALARDRVLRSPLVAWFEQHAADGRMPAPVMVAGVLREDAATVPAGVRVLVEVHQLGEGDTSLPIRGRIQALVVGSQGPAQRHAWTAGRPFVAPMLLRVPDVVRNPGASPERWQRLRRPFDLAGTIKSASLVHVERGPPWREWPAAVRRHVRDAVARHVATRRPQSAAVVAAILIGDRVGLDDELERRLQAAGTYHTIAISGGNVAIVTALCLLILRGPVRSPRVSASVTLVVVLAYGAVVNGQPSVARAVTAACVYLMVSLAGLVPSAVRVVGAVALIVSLADPLAVLDAGAWFSFGATLAIVVAVPRCLAWVDRHRPAAAAPQTMAWRLGRIAVASLAATVAAELALLPVATVVFQRITVAGLVLNSIAIPAMAVVQGAGLAVALSSGWWDGAAAICGQLADAGAVVLLGSASMVDWAPWLSWRVPAAPAFVTAGFYVAWGAVLVVAGSRRARLMAWAAAILVTLAVGAGPALEASRPAQGRLRITMLDVGQGDACLVQFPGGRSLLIDTGGSAGAFDIGARVVTPAVWALGVRRLEWLAITHPDIDHAGGASSVAHDLTPREVWEGVPVPASRPREALQQTTVRSGGVWRQVSAGHQVEVAGAQLEVVHPEIPDWERPRPRNDDSLVLRLRFGAIEIWLTGDAGREFESRVVPVAAPGVLRVLKVGHHGSRTSSSAAFLRALRPDLAIISAGRSNTFGHPTPEVLARLAAQGVRVLRTDRDGAIMLETDGATIDARAIAGARWMMSAWPRRSP